MSSSLHNSPTTLSVGSGNCNARPPRSISKGASFRASRTEGFVGSAVTTLKNGFFSFVGNSGPLGMMSGKALVAIFVRLSSAN